MNKLLSSLGAKIAAIILFMISIIVLAAMVFGIVLLGVQGVYFDNGESTREELYVNYCHTQIHYINELYENAIVDPTQEVSSQKLEIFGKNLDKESTNFAFTLYSEDGTEIYRNFEVQDPAYETSQYITAFVYKEEKSDVISFESYQDRWQSITQYQKEYYDVYYDYYDEDTDDDGDMECILDIHYTIGDQVRLFIEGSVPKELSARDNLYYQLKWYDFFVGLRYQLIVFAALSFIIAVVLFVFLMCSAGHKAGVEGIHLNWMDKIPFDLYLTFVVTVLFFTVYCLSEGFGYWYLELLIVGGVLAVIGTLFTLGVIMSFATRAKKGNWWKNTIIYRLLVLIKKIVVKLWNAIYLLISSIPVIWKTVLVLVILSIINLGVLFSWDDGFRFVVWLIETIVLVPFIMLLAINFRKLQKSVGKLCEGDFDSKIDTEHMFMDFKKFAESINNVNDGMAKEVSARMKSEHLKTELITNVSHDIKTPLTSIINYVDLIKKEASENENIKNYIDVLDRQSGRLKKLIEDLVECSKATTGNISVNMTPIDVGILLEQAAGEYNEKFEANQLSMLIDKPEKPVHIFADGRYLWRVFDNLLNNACKYSLPSSRVYLSLEPVGRDVHIVFRNISKTRLNISGEELIERFVRGDSSRNTEGSGLGLSIAESLIKLQKGDFKLSVDGDLFKVVITFKIIGE